MLETHPYYSFYSYNNNKYHGKVMALAALGATKNNADIVWKLPNFEKELEKLNLLQEPRESLQDLYLTRAQDLRNTYDYLILNYSGGPDSHNILETFLLNNIFLDEIFIYSYFSEETIVNLQNNYPTTFVMFPEFYEAQKSAIPVARYLVEKYSPHTKITYVDNFYQLHKVFWENINEKNYLENIKGNASVLLTHRHIARYRNPNFVPEWKTIKNRKKTAHIWGIEKPNIVYDNIGVYFELLDHTILSRIDLQHILTVDGIPNNHELFYIHPKSVKMFLKQAHIIAKTFSKDFFKNPEISTSTRKKQDALARVIYSFKTKLPYSGLKLGDLITKYEDVPLLKELAKTGIIPGYADMTEPLNLKLYADDKNSLSSINYDKFLSFIYHSLFKGADKKQLLHTLCLGFTSKRYYIKIH
jgi:hypothetical protein